MKTYNEKYKNYEFEKHIKHLTIHKIKTVYMKTLMI